MPRSPRPSASALEELCHAKAAASAWYVRGARNLTGSLEMHTRVTELQRRAGDLVHAVGIGRKRSGDKLESTLCVRLYVTRKLPRRLLSAIDLLPAQIDGIPTDVIEAPQAYFAAPISPCSIKRLTRQRPLVCGSSFGNVAVVGGTLGARVRSTRAGESALRLVLSNNHVLADFGLAPVGSAVCQPSVADSGDPQDIVGRLLRFAPISVGSGTENHVDAAVAEIEANTQVAAGICTVGAIQGVASAAIDQPVHKHARTTGYTSGSVDDIDCDVLIPLSRTDPTQVARFTHQIRLRPRTSTTRFAQAGDSGAVVLDKLTNRAVGLLFACPDNGSYAYANSIERVLEALDIEFA